MFPGYKILDNIPFIYTKSCPFFHDIVSVTYLVNNIFSETGGVQTLESKQHALDKESTETVTCSEKVRDPGQNVVWYRVRTRQEIKSEGRFQLNVLSLKISNVQLNDAGTYECRGKSKRQYLTIYVNGEFFLCTFCSSLRHHLFFHLTMMLSCCS